MNKIWLLGIAVCMLLTLQSCGGKKSSYKSAYETAKERNSSVDDYSDEFGDDNIAPVNKPRSDSGEDEYSNEESNYDDNYSPVQEDLYPYSSYDNNSSVNSNVQVSFNLKRYNVVIGSFRNATNANALKERMQREGYTVDLAKNEAGLIRVIVKTTDNRSEALKERTAFRAKHYPNFQDSWVLRRY